MLDALDLLDKSLFKTINHAGSELLDGPMIFISKGSSWLFLYVAFIYLFYKKWAKKSWIPILTLLTAVGVSDRFSSGVLKPQIKRERPCKVEALQARTPSGCNSPYGFVSSHASNHAVLAFFVIATLQPPTLISTLLIFWVILIAFSRVYLGVHYPGDVLAGMLLGSFIAWIFVWFHKKLLHRFSVNSHL